MSLYTSIVFVFDFRLGLWHHFSVEIVSKSFLIINTKVSCISKFLFEVIFNKKLSAYLACTLTQGNKLTILVQLSSLISIKSNLLERGPQNKNFRPLKSFDFQFLNKNISKFPTI